MEEQILLANARIVASRVSVELPMNQWQMEIENLFNISLAMFQHFGVLFVSPPELQLGSNLTYDMYITAPNTTEGKNICNSQKILSNGQYSFSLFGLLFILVGGLLVIVLSNAIPPLVAQWQAKSSDERAQYRRREWIDNDVLYLQKIALESSGIGPWRANVKVPALMKGDIRFRIPWLLGDDDSKNNSRVALLPLRDASSQPWSPSSPGVRKARDLWVQNVTEKGNSEPLSRQSCVPRADRRKAARSNCNYHLESTYILNDRVLPHDRDPFLRLQFLSPHLVVLETNKLEARRGRPDSKGKTLKIHTLPIFCPLFLFPTILPATQLLPTIQLLPQI
jgi:hypothetical protein